MLSSNGFWRYRPIIAGFLLVLALVFGSIGCGRPVDPAVPPPSYAEDADWLMQAVTDDGAIAQYIDRKAIRPYMAHFAAIALAQATRVTGDPSYAEAAWDWLEWYYGHMNADGFVYDYNLWNGTWQSTGDMDSTDSYAALFLVAYAEAWKATGDVSRMNELRPAIIKAVGAIEHTQDSDGLTWAKPSYHVKYLMDNVEVYAGLKAGLELADYFGDTALADRIQADLDNVATGIASLWNDRIGSYDWAKHESGSQMSCDWQYFYPDSVAQVWLVAFGMVTGDRAERLMESFAANHPHWDDPTSQDLFRDNGLAAIGYWPEIGWAYRNIGDSARAALAGYRIRQVAINANRAWPFNSKAAGELFILQAGGL